MALYNFPLANVYHMAFGRRSIMKTYSVRLHMENSFRRQMLLPWPLLIENLPDFKTVFLVFYTVNFLCFRENRVNMKGASTGKATRKCVHKFWRNSQFPFLTRTTLIRVKFDDFFLSTREIKSFSMYQLSKKKLPSGKRAICVFRSLKNPCFS